MKTLLFLLTFFISNLLFSQEINNREFQITEGDTTYIMKKYIMCFLIKGENRDQSKEEAEKIQEGHMAHINKLAEDGHVIMAGPFGDDSEKRGILLFDVESIEEAEKLESEDPAVKSGRLAMEFHPWWTAKGTVLK